MKDIAEATTRDHALLASAHQAAFPGFFLSTLGSGALASFYRASARERHSFGVMTLTVEGTPVGAAVGTMAPAGHYKRLLATDPKGFAAAGLHLAVSHPVRLLGVARRLAHSAPTPAVQHSALLTSIFAAPSARGQGHVLLRAWEEAARSRGASSAHLLTDADDNARTIAFYQRYGWEIEETHTALQGRRMHLFAKSLS